MANNRQKFIPSTAMLTFIRTPLEQFRRDLNKISNTASLSPQDGIFELEKIRRKANLLHGNTPSIQIIIAFIEHFCNLLRDAQKTIDKTLEDGIKHNNLKKIAWALQHGADIDTVSVTIAAYWFNPTDEKELLNSDANDNLSNNLQNMTLDEPNFDSIPLPIPSLLTPFKLISQAVKPKLNPIMLEDRYQTPPPSTSKNDTKQLASPDATLLKTSAFKKIYAALHSAQFNSDRLKSNFLLGKEELDASELIKQIEIHTKNKPNGRSAKAWALTEKYFQDCHSKNVELVNEIYKFACENTLYAGLKLFPSLGTISSFSKEQVQDGSYCKDARGACIQRALDSEEKTYSYQPNI